MTVTRAQALSNALTRPDSLAYWGAKCGLIIGPLPGETHNIPTSQPDQTSLAIYEGSAIVVTETTPAVWRPTTQGGTNTTFTRPDYSSQTTAVANTLLPWGGYLAVHGGQASWITTASTYAQTLAALQYDVQTIMERYSPSGALPTPFDFWIVANECLNPGSGLTYNYRPCTWQTNMPVPSTGFDYSDYVSQSFIAARAADSTATLVLGDEFFNFAFDQYQLALQQAGLTLLEKLVSYSGGSLVDGVMLQCHTMAGFRVNFGQVKSFLDSLHSMGLKAYMGELDVFDQYAPAGYTGPTGRDSWVARQFQDLLTMIVEHPATQSLGFWGLVDPYSWIQANTDDAGPRADGLPNRPCLYDGNDVRKLSYYAVRGVLQRQAAKIAGSLPHGGFVLTPEE